MPGENYGLAYLQATNAAAQQDIAQAKAPVELQHLQAMSRLENAQAETAEMNMRLQKQGLAALEGMEFDKAHPTQSMTEAAFRLAPYQPLLSEKMLSAAQLSMYREAQVKNYEALAQERQMKAGQGMIQALTNSYGGLPSTSPEMLGLARQMFTSQARAAGMPEDQINEEVQYIESALAHGKDPKATIDYLARQGMSALQTKKIEMDQRRQDEREKMDRERLKVEQANLQLRREAGERAKAKMEADGKAGRGPKDPATKISTKDARVRAAQMIELDPTLSGAEKAQKLMWASRIGDAALQKIQQNQAQRARNQNIPVLSPDEAFRQAKEETASGVTHTPHTFGKDDYTERQAKPGAPSWETFLSAAKAKNPTFSTAEIRKHWEEKYAE